MNTYIELDALDLRLLQEIQQDSARSNQALAAQIHVSPATALRRVNRLTEAGVIAKQVAILDPQKLTPSITAILEVTLERQDAETLSAFEAKVTTNAAVLQCYRVSAGPDFVLIVQTLDMSDYQSLVEGLLNATNQVRNVRAFFSSRRSKFLTNVPTNILAARVRLD